MAERIIDATGLIAGRLSSHAAKLALNGDTVHVINCDKAVITGSRPTILTDQLAMRERGNINKGPYVFNNSDQYLRRVIRGMLPHKFDRGRKAYARVRCWTGTPEAFKTKPTETIAGAHVSKVLSARSMSLAEISHAVGGTR